MATRLFVGNLPKSTVENDVQNAFSHFGEITNIDLKSKPGCDESKKFAFITLCASNYDIESCITHFTTADFKGDKLYVTRARESFLERLQRERDQAKKAESANCEPPKLPASTPEIKLSETLNPRRRRDYNEPINNKHTVSAPIFKNKVPVENGDASDRIQYKQATSFMDKKKLDSDAKRMESMKKKRQEFKQKQNIIKTGLTGIDKVQNKKIKFSDDEAEMVKTNGHVLNTQTKTKNTLFDENDEDSGDELNFEIKKQFEGKKGQKVLDLQSRYKSDKRFVLDERFIDEDQNDNEKEDDAIELEQMDEKNKQLDILQDVLGVTLKRKHPDDEKDNKKSKPKIGMLRFDPTQPEHAKFLAPVEKTTTDTKKSKKKSKEKIEVAVDEPKQEEPRPEVSKETFYKVSETLKEAIAQPTSFSLRSLFGNKEDSKEESKNNEEANYVALEPAKKPKMKNPLNPKEKNPFVYDSSDSETEEVDNNTTKPETTVTENKAVWKENLFFAPGDQRLIDGLAFFNNTTETQKDRRELKSLMKKRIHNTERKNQMFQKKIGGRKKTMKKSFNKRKPKN